MKQGILLINLGTPDSPSVGDVRKYLREFLMDGRVIDIPFINRFFLVNGIIAPFRAFDSAKAYQQLWTEEGSPLKTYGYQVRGLLQEALGDSYHVSLGMRYQDPTIKSALKELNDNRVTSIKVIPLYPQYASASTGSTIEAVLNEVKEWEVVPSIEIISKFFDHPKFIEAFTVIGRTYLEKEEYDHVLFSYHGLPERQIRKSSVGGYCQLNEKCCARYGAANQYCYRAQCYETTRLLAEGLSLEPSRFTVCFQSRLGRDPWVKPYTDGVIKDLAQKGAKRILCFSPAFVADCLETTVEIAEEYNEMFQELGGERIDLVESLNSHPLWIECLKDLACADENQNTPVNL